MSWWAGWLRTAIWIWTIRVFNYEIARRAFGELSERTIYSRPGVVFVLCDFRAAFAIPLDEGEMLEGVVLIARFQVSEGMGVERQGHGKQDGDGKEGHD